MKSYPQISVIIPVYNAEKYIEKCVRSLFEQTFDSIEYIFVDDCSCDRSIEIVQSILTEFPKRAENTIIITQKNNQGVAAARNVGLSKARGQYVMFCDSDDWLDLCMLEKMYNAIKSEDADVAMCDFYMVFRDEKNLFQMPLWHTDNKFVSLREYIQFIWNVVWNLLIKRDVCIKYNLYFSVGYAYCEDFNFSVKLLDTAKSVVNVREPLYYYNRLNMDFVMYKIWHGNDFIIKGSAMRDEQMMYLDVIQWFERKNTLVHYQKELSWRILKSKQEWILSPATFVDFMTLYPESHKYIWSCPFIGVKLKIMMWCLTHHLKTILILILRMRNLKNRFLLFL